MPILSDMSLLHQLLSVGIAAFISESSSHPLEVAKINRQTLAQAGNLTEAKSSDLKIWHLFKKSIYDMNPKHLYKGLSAAILMSFKGKFVGFATYDYLIDKFTNGLDDECAPLHTKLLASALSAFTTFWVFNPWDLIRVRMAADSSGEYGSLRGALVKTFRTDGLIELYKGSSLNIGFIVLASSTDLTIYQHTKEYLEKRMGKPNGQQFDARIPIIASTIASIATSFITFPVDYLKNVYVNEHSKG